MAQSRLSNLSDEKIFSPQIQGRARVYSCGRDGPITSFTTFHNVNCRHGFVFSTLSGQIKVSLTYLSRERILAPDWLNLGPGTSLTERISPQISPQFLPEPTQGVQSEPEAEDGPELVL